MRVTSICRVNSPPPFSTYDSLNHVLALDELEQVFRRVYRHLSPGGVFVFDMNMEEGFVTRWSGSFPIVTKESAVILLSWYDEREKLAFADVTAFTQDESEKPLWRRSDFQLTQRAYSEDALRSALASAGFADIQVYDSRRDFAMREEGRGFFRALKP